MSSKGSKSKSFADEMKEAKERRERQKKEREARHNEYEARQKEYEEKQRQQKEKEELKRQKEKELKRQKKKEIEDDMRECVSKFLASKSIHKRARDAFKNAHGDKEAAKYVDYKGTKRKLPKSMRILVGDNVRNDQQKLPINVVWEEFCDEYGYEVINHKQYTLFKKIVNEYPNNFTDEDPDFRAKLNSAAMNMTLRETNEVMARDKAKIHMDSDGRDQAMKTERSLKMDPLHVAGTYQAETTKRAIKHEELKQYPPRFTTSAPQPLIDIKSTAKPKLNLSHVFQVHQPESVKPSENTRAKGQIQGLEEDGKIWNSEKGLYITALKEIGGELPKHDHDIHATNDVRAAVRSLKHGKALSKRLVSWR